VGFINSTINKFNGAVFLLLLQTFALSDSPLTAVEFHKVYMDIPAVARAGTLDSLTPDMISYLLDDSARLDIKLAVINALHTVWGKTTSNGVLFRQALSHKYHTTPRKLKWRKLKAHDLMCLGYLQVQDKFYRPAENALLYMETAARRLNKSYSAQLVTALAHAQKKMNCKSWELYEDVKSRKGLKFDIRKEADDIVMNYFKKHRCPKVLKTKPPTLENRKMH
jgi:hypothetical protein